jgi:hypothetical protein
MTPPYSGEEVLTALLAAGRLRGIALHDAEVRADELTRTWIILATLPDGLRRASFPFASPAGIYTPSELAERFLSEAWPFE